MDSGTPVPARPHFFRNLPGAGWVGLVFLVTCLIYAPALHGGFIWDDDHHVPQGAMQSLHGLWRIWFEVGATQQYYPLLHGAFWLEHRLWGEATVGYHLVNVLCHATSACLFALVLRRLVGPALRGYEWFAALLFAVHPVCVESVAWISEQKNTLSTVFYLLAALAYLRFDEDRRPRTYGLALGLFVLALLSKTVTATLPAALLVAFWWRRGSLPWRRDVVPLLPWLGFGAVAGLFSGWVERTYVGAQGGGFELSLAQRALVAGREVWFYLGKFLWPANLIFIYPRWAVDASQAWQWLFPVGALVLLAGCWFSGTGPAARSRRCFSSSAPCFPRWASSISTPFGFRMSPTTGNIWRAWESSPWWPEDGRGGRRGAKGAAGRVPVIAAALLVAVLALLAWRQSRMYTDIDTFYRTTLAENPDCWLAHNNLANRLLEEGQLPEAIEHYQAAARLDGSDPESFDNLGIALAAARRPGEAEASFRQALALRPSYADAHYNLGLVLSDAGRCREAIGEYGAALRFGPDRAEIRNSLGAALARSNRLPEAVGQFQAALQLQPGNVEARNNFALALRLLGAAAAPPQRSQP